MHIVPKNFLDIPMMIAKADKSSPFVKLLTAFPQIQWTFIVIAYISFVGILISLLYPVKPKDAS